MIRRILSCAAAAGLLLLFALSAGATQLGRIQVETEGGTVALYRVGDFEDTHFRLSQTYGGGKVTFEESLSPELAADLAERATSGYVKAADLHGNVVFSDRAAGLYLVVQRTAPQGYAPFSPFLVSLPWDGDQWDVKATPKLEGEQPVTGDRRDPTLWFAMMCFSAAGILCCMWKGKDYLEQV